MARKCLFFVQWEASRFVDVIGAVVLYIKAVHQNNSAMEFGDGEARMGTCPVVQPAR